MVNLPPPQIGKNRLLHDTELARWNYKSRALFKGYQKQRAWPETIRINGGDKSNLDLSDKWLEFLRNINTAQAYKFMQVRDSGWHNKADWPKVEKLTTGGNFVEVTRIDGDKCYIKHYSNLDKPPDTKNPNFYDETLIHNFWITNNKDGIEYPPCGLCRILVISRDHEELWVSKEYLTFVDQIEPRKYPEIVTVNFGMNLREFHTITSNVVGRIPPNMKTQIEEIFQDGENYWGRIGESWLCLKLNGQYFTSWRV